MSKIQWVVNEVVGRDVFHGKMISDIDDYMKSHQQQTIDALLRGNVNYYFSKK